MTNVELIAKLECVKEILVDNIPMEIGVRTTLALQSDRIFNKGLNSAGSSIGQYDTTRPLYVNPNKQERATADSKLNISGLIRMGKNGQTKFKNGKPHKTAYSANYKDLRNKQGLNISYVDLNYTGNLKSNFENSSRGTPEPIKIGNNTYLVGLDGDNKDKREGLESKYGVVFNTTIQEREAFYGTVQFELDKQIKECLS